MADIVRFNGKHHFLSNFYYHKPYVTVEHQFQACKTMDPVEQSTVLDAKSPREAKRLGRRVVLREDWEQRKRHIMFALVHMKFKNPELAEKLIATHPFNLVEGNTWNDTYWGVNSETGVGENHLGKILMQVREHLMNPSTLGEFPELKN